MFEARQWRGERGERRLPPGSWLWLLVAFGAALGTLAWLTHEPSPRFETRADLWEELGAFRPVEGRLVGLPHAAVGTVPTKNQLRPVARQLEIRKAQKASPQAVADLAIVRLADGAAPNMPRSRYAPAVDLLEGATTQEPTNGRLWSDLAAVRLAQGKEESDLKALILALSAAEKAVKAEPQLPEALFNRALALDALHLRHVAREAWQRYLEQDSKSQWAKEAQQALDRLNLPTARDEWLALKGQLDALKEEPEIAEWAREAVRKFPQQARELAEEELLGEWGRAHEAGEGARAEKVLTAAREIGRRLVERNQDYLVADAVGVIDEAGREGDGRRLGLLARGHVGFREGLTLLRQRQLELALQTLGNSEDLLRKVGSAFEVRALLQLATSEHQAGRPGRVLRLLKPDLQSTGWSRFPAQFAKACWLAGVSHAKRGELTDSLAAYGRARSIFDRLGEAENLATAAFLLAENYRLLGSEESLWEILTEGVALAPSLQAANRRQGSLEDLQALAREMGEPRAALPLFEEALAIRASEGAPISRFAVLRDRASLLLATGDWEAALWDLDLAMEDLASQGDELRQRANLPGLLRLRGEIELAAANPQGAAESFERALDVAQANQEGHMIPATLTQLAGARLAIAASARREGANELIASSTRAAGEALSLAMAEAEGQLAGLKDPERIADFREVVADIFRAQVLLRVQSGELVEALGAAERERSPHPFVFQGPQGLAGSPAGRLLSVQKIQASLGPGVVLVEWVVLDQMMLALLAKHGELQAVQLEKGRRWLQVAVARLHQTGETGGHDRAFRAASSELYNELLRPLGESLSGATRLVFVPDVDLEAVPFAALFDAITGRYLVENAEIVIAPSASVYGSARRRPATRMRLTPIQLLSVGNPAFDRQKYPYLRETPEAEVEARVAAENASTATLLIGTEATPESFLRAAEAADLIFYAGHALVRADRPQQSGLLLAPDHPGSSGLLTTGRLRGLVLPRTRLVALAACRSAGSVLRRRAFGEWVGSFLAAGVPEVVATHWSIPDSKATVSLMKTFVRSALAGDSGVAALAKAQREAISSLDSENPNPAVWGAFSVFGGYPSTEGSGEKSEWPVTM